MNSHFSDPKNDNERQIETLSPDKRALLEKKLKEERTGLPSQQTIPKRDNNDATDLSFSQQRLWFLDQLEPGSTAYNIPLLLKLTGNLQIAALQQSIGEILRRHEVLRTVFPVEMENPVQRIIPATVFNLPQIDFRKLSDEQREAKVRRLLDEEATKPFNLATGPLVRLTLVHLKPLEYLLLLTMHHIVSDGWSTGVLFRELSVLYEAFSRGKSSPLPELPIQYADFAVWQREWLQGERLEEQLAYWKKQLGGKLPILKLPTDYGRPPEPTHQGDLCSLLLSEELSTSLKIFSQQQRGTLFMTMLAVFSIILHRLTSQDDIILGAPIANRSRHELEGLIGFFVNTLVLRTNLSDSPTFEELLGRIRDVTLDAYTHQDLPFEKLVEELQPDRNLSHSPLFQVMLNMVNLSQDPIRLTGVQTETVPLNDMESKFDLTLYIFPKENGIKLDLVYNKALFKRSRMQEMLYQMKYLLEQVVKDPGKSIDKFSLCTPHSLHLLPDPKAILSEREYPLVMTMFLEHVEQSPDQPAVYQGGKTWTYQQLADSALKLAQALCCRGIEKGEAVAVTGPKSFGIVAAAISVFFSGGVLLLIDQGLPAARKRILCREAKVKYLLHVGNREENDGWFQKLHPLKILPVEPDSGMAVEDGNAVNPSQVDLPRITPEDSAYIFYTSGTTGVPRGVLCSHKGLSHFLVWQRDTFAVGPGDRCAQLTGFSFDVILRDIFLPLVSGATLCLPDETVSLFSDLGLLWLESERITLVHVVPSVVHSWLDNVPSGITLRSLRVVFFAGEPLRETLLRKWDNAFIEGGKIVNLYGTTETTLAKCFFEVPLDHISGVQPIGRPLPETQALILTKSGQLCGIGEIGEIVLRTPFRSLGYINAPDDYRSRFVQNPFRDDPDDIVYLTGDLGRYRPDGMLQILGRLDDQIKIRGVRIEPEEIIAALERNDQVGSAYVAPGKDSQGENILVAYIVPSKQAELISSTLRTHLKKHLPDYMMPSVFIVLDSFPLTPNGKVDRRALPKTTIDKAELDNVFVKPRTLIEKGLAIIWSEVLGHSRVGIMDNFFELGGHSLKGTQIISRIRTVFNVDLPILTLFRNQTVKELALEISRLTKDSGMTHLVNMVSELDELSDEEVKRLLAEERGEKSPKRRAR